MNGDELIRRGDVLALAEEFEIINQETGERIVYRTVEPDAVASIPAVDAVEVVRCRKCTRFALNPVAWTDDRPIICFSNDPEGFCHNGTPREEDGDG